MRLRLLGRSVLSWFWWLCGKVQDEAIKYAVVTAMASGIGYLSLESCRGDKAPTKSPPAVIEKGWEAKVRKSK